jgi:ABC-type nitrate/sulfonate/bicarbonate transport system ATPase subunit
MPSFQAASTGRERLVFRNVAKHVAERRCAEAKLAREDSAAADSYPWKLSGGMQQRVLSRAPWLISRR